ncbi:HPF/RaiA family ribosome-associated protein [Azospirillum doebereinerae]|uniref:Ribosome-associated translation inhibitor RaiA n=1 Tax=Azospirillum doebereinerae TaxID=92933 RepID=A0A3S0XPB0_9PROT|nr:HPF/RaiA family ribosome-associated protein [Azospirillum doebereinerae]MCG5242588.1 HPF/RaiA family ribosome-associated protein [Azospirillum doebereinerae]RUQ74081.1 ribosome-associated translation inhibitor RaiA [Azospirillum doebereinerae]
MDTNLEITFHNMTPLPDVESCIRERAEKLERLYDRMVGLRVAVESQHRQHRTGNLYDVHIEMRVPGDELVVSRPPHHARERHASPDALTSVRDAFEAAERRLKDYKERKR